MRNSGIYQIVNTVNDKRYVGSAVDLNHRWVQHLSLLRLDKHYNRYLQRAWNKHGETAFEFRVVGKCPPKRLVALEQEVIDHLKPEYNMAPTANSMLGFRFTDASKAKMSTAQLGKKITDVTKAKMSAAHLGQPGYFAGRRHTEATKVKIRAKSLGKRHTEATKARLSAVNSGEDHSWVKLSALDVAEMRRLYATNRVTQRLLGKMFHISYQQVSRIINFKRWKTR